MSQGLSVSLSEYPFDEYFSSCSISIETQNKLDSTDILILPSPYENSKYYFAQESVNFVKYCRSTDNSVKTDILSDNDKIEVRALHSFDIWMPLIWVASNIIFPIALNLAANYIFERIKGREKEECNVKLTFVVKDGENTKKLHYDGDAKTFRETFEKIDINNL